MKKAIASEEKDKNSIISEKAGRAPYYLIFEDKNIIKIIKNPFTIGGCGAGWSVTDMLNDENVQKEIAGNMGANMQAALKQKGIKMKITSRKINNIIK